MPIKVPVYEERVSLNPAPVATPKASALPASAFASSSSEVGQRLGQALSDIAPKLAAHAQQKEAQEHDKQADDLFIKFREAATQGLYDTTEENGKPKGAMARNGDLAKGAYKDTRSFLSTLRSQIVTDDLPEPVREKLGKLIDRDSISMSEDALRHERVQGEAAYQGSVLASLKQAHDKVATATSPQSFQTQTDIALGILRDSAHHQGMTPKQLTMREKELYGSMLESYLKVNLESNPAEARRVLAQVRGAVPADIYAEYEQKARDTDFIIKAMEKKQAGATLPELTSWAKEKDWSPDADSQIKNMAALKKLFAQTDHATYNTISDGIDNGTITKVDILDKKWNEGLLDEGDYRSLKERLTKSNSGGEGSKLSADMKFTYEGLKLMGKRTLKKDDARQKEFEYVLGITAHQSGMTPELLTKKAEELLSRDTVTKNWWPDSDQYHFESEIQKVWKVDSAKGMAMQNAYEWLKSEGRDTSLDSINKVLAKFPEGRKPAPVVEEAPATPEKKLKSTTTDYSVVDPTLTRRMEDKK